MESIEDYVRKIIPPGYKPVHNSRYQRLHQVKETYNDDTKGDYSQDGFEDNKSSSKPEKSAF